jgi:hypothetical protein
MDEKKRESRKDNRPPSSSLYEKKRGMDFVDSNRGRGEEWKRKVAWVLIMTTSQKSSEQVLGLVHEEFLVNKIDEHVKVDFGGAEQF